MRQLCNLTAEKANVIFDCNYIRPVFQLREKAVIISMCIRVNHFQGLGFSSGRKRALTKIQE